jgi:hypothetical protein
MRTRHAGYHAFGAFGGLALVSSGMAGLFLVGSPTTPPINPCNITLTAATSPSNTASSGTSTSPSNTPSTTPITTTPSPNVSGPSTTPTTSPPTGQLCVRVQAMSSASPVLPGADASFAVWVWFAGTTSGDASVALTTQPANLAPVFTVCPQPGTASCLVTLAAGQPTELEAKVTVPQKAAPSSITLTATGTSPEAASSAAAWDSVSVKTPTTPTPTPTGSSAGSTPTPAGVGGALPPGAFPPGTLPPAALPAGVLPSASLPALPDPATSPAVAFPQLSPDPTPAAPARPIRVADVSAQFPLDARLVGGQIAGLAVLAAAITIAVARLSLRKQRPQHSKDPG